MCPSNEILFPKLRPMKKLMESYFLNAVVFEIFEKQNKENGYFMEIRHFHKLVGVLHCQIYYFWNPHRILNKFFFDAKTMRGAVSEIF